LNAAQFVRAVTRRTIELLIAADGNIDYAEAERRAAQEVAAAERARPKSITPPPSVNNNAGGGAKARLLAALGAIAARSGMRGASVAEGAMGSGERRNWDTPAPVRKIAAPLAPATAEQEPAADTLLIYAGGSPTGAQLISDDEYPIRYRDPTTANWRASIKENERRARALGRG
jgi:hypothetical protein